MGHTIAKVAFVLMLLLCLTGGRRGADWVTEGVSGGAGGAPPAGGPLVVNELFFDDFTDNASKSNWEDWSDTYSQDCQDIDSTTADSLYVTDQGNCRNTSGGDASPGGDGIIYAYYGAGVSMVQVGAGLRWKTADAPTTGEPSYAARCESDSVFDFRSCEGGANCTDIYESLITTCNDQVGDQLAFMVAGTGANTELCIWNWDSGDGDIPDESVAAERKPTDWKVATICVAASGGTSLPILENTDPPFVDCDGSGSNGTTSCFDWTTAPSAIHGYADSTMGIGAYTGTAQNRDFAFFAGGEIE